MNMLSWFSCKSTDSQYKASTNGVNDKRFLSRIRILQELREFLLYSGIAIPERSSRVAVQAGRRTYHKKGDDPDPTEVADVEAALEILLSLLRGPLRKKFLLTQFPRWMSILAVACLALIITSLLFLVQPKEWTLLLPHALIPLHLVAYLIWLPSMGALGAISFVSMNVLSVQEDVTFDLTSTRLLTVRFIIGALFGLVMSLPFGHEKFVAFGEELVHSRALSNTDAFEQALFLLLPFLLGFSTTLVIFILNRLVDGVQTLFGLQQEKNSRPSGPSPESQCQMLRVGGRKVTRVSTRHVYLQPRNEFWPSAGASSPPGSPPDPIRPPP
ncbi:hypothetical protein [Caballeronia sordidicola]|uniref:hypothetical protein n=1 Tax=Caballeronia sordidicola TaxID=196367 RepID=UPI0004D02C37|nr:hypothetical protein [Caballeronia sordidicola]